ncbi:MAG TPA: site-specific integrase [Firmicutes bacterium]|nr:site-specific integrase [Bacillota bacterium]
MTPLKGHIRKRSEKSYSVVIYLGRDELTGKQKYKWYTVHGNKREAERFLAKKITELEAGLPADPGKLTMAEYLRIWLEKYAKPKVGPRTLESYTQIIEQHLIPALGRIPIARLSPTHLQEYYLRALQSGRKDGKPGGLSARSVLYHHRILHKALRTAVKWRIVPYNAAEAADPPSMEQKEMRSLTSEQAVLLLRALEGDRLYALFLLALATGMRQSELLGLRWEDVNFDNLTISVRQTLQKRKGQLLVQGTKTSKSRRQVAISQGIAEVLLKHKAQQNRERPFYREDNGFVFCTANGTPISARNLTRKFKAVLKAAGLPDIRFYDLRHTHASLLLQAGVNPKVVSERLGHSQINLTLDTYSHVLPGLQEQAATSLDHILFPDENGSGRVH